MPRPIVKLLVTDLDNTLYDWVGYFAKAFRAMVDEAVPLLGIDREELLDQLQAVHRRHHDSERPFSLAETEAAQQRWPSRLERMTALDPAFHAFNKIRKQHLSLYPTVDQTLASIRSVGVTIVGHTEASTINALRRVTKLGLATYLDELYAADGGDEPSSEPLPVVAVPRDIHKPDPRILLDICRDHGVSPADALYVGDSIARDIGMAKQIGMHAAWAAYGTRHASEDWHTLVRVTHWTNEDVERANAAQQRFGTVQPDVTLEQFDELLECYDFRSAQGDTATRSA